MRIIDCYYIKGYGNDSKCYKIHGVGITYNLIKSVVYIKGIGFMSTALSIPPLGLMIGLGVGEGFVSAAINTIKNGGVIYGYY